MITSTFTQIVVLIDLTASISLLILIVLLKHLYNNAPKLPLVSETDKTKINTSLTIVIPTYNEALKIRRCLSSVISSASPCKSWQIVLADDSSTDNTVNLAKEIQKEFALSEDFFKIIDAGPRPKEERWVGKNWPCTCAAEATESDWLLFIDADTDLTQDTLLRAVNHIYRNDLDLLSLAPRVECSCLSEWIVQPIITSLLGIGFPINKTNNPLDKTAFAAGPFMLFKRESYKEVGGHRILAGEVVEDLALARLIKDSGLKLTFLLGLDAINLRMYSNISELWEGWSKNWFIGLDRNIVKALGASLFVFYVFALPVILIPIMLVYTNNMPLDNIHRSILIITSLLPMGIQYYFRSWSSKEFKLPRKYWWLMWMGGIFIGCIGPNSIFKTLTGRGWTWKGRSLANY